MKTNHVEYTGPVGERPPYLPIIKPEHLCKAKYQEGNNFCYTGWLLELFLGGHKGDKKEYVGAYKEFRLKTMDILYNDYSEDHANGPYARAAVFNKCAYELGYRQIDMEEWRRIV